MTQHTKRMPHPHAMLERRIRHQFGLPDSLARFVAEQLGGRGRG
jgi:hypothetical protein